MRWLAGVFAVVGLAASPISSAATLDLTGAVGAAIAAGSAEVVSYSGNADFGTVTFDANPTGSDISWSLGNGLGIDCPRSTAGCSIDTTYQIDYPEILSLSFDSGPVFITSVDLGQLVPSNFKIGRYVLHIDEGGSIEGAGFDIAFSSDDADAQGHLTVDINRWAASLSFVPDRWELNDFTLAGISIDQTRRAVPAPGSPIPEPSSVLLMILGGALVASQARKHI